MKHFLQKIKPMVHFRQIFLQPKVLFILLLIPSVYYATRIFSMNFNTGWQQFSELAEQFLRGKLHLINPTPVDSAYYNGLYYWPLGPFPAVFIIPFKLLFGYMISQTHLQIVLILAAALLCFLLSKRHGFNWIDSVFLAYAFLFASIYAGLMINPNGWYFAHMVSSVLLLLVLYELEFNRRWMLLGILCGLLYATRTTSAFIVMSVLGYIYYFSSRTRDRVEGFILFLVPLLCLMFVALLYNYARFGNLFESGYGISQVDPIYVPVRELGFFSILHLPTNIYYYFFASFVKISDSTYRLIFPYITYDYHGLSLFLIAPFFVLSFRTLKSKHFQQRLLWITCGLTLLVLLFYYGTGWMQFGPRYTADFFPILFLLTLKSFKNTKLNTWHYILISLSGSLNIYLLYYKTMGF